MTAHLSISSRTTWSVPEKTLRRWVADRLRRETRAQGGVVYSFALSGSTCNNVPIEVVMTVAVDEDGRIEAASSCPAHGDQGCDAMCTAHGNGSRFLATVGDCPEVIGLTLAEAAMRPWDEEVSGCFCTDGNRRHKWRNLFQTLHYATTHGDD
jgi:hypothetical protein